MNKRRSKLLFKLQPAPKVCVVVSRFGNLRILLASGLLAAFLFALTLAASPQLHARIHPDAGTPNHECAVTLIATGKYAHADAPPVLVAPQPALLFAKIPAFFPVWVAAPFFGAAIFEHAPPALS